MNEQLEEIPEQIEIEDKPGFHIEEIIDEFRVITERIEGTVPMYLTRIVRETLDLAFFPIKRMTTVKTEEAASSDIAMALSTHNLYLQNLKRVYL